MLTEKRYEEILKLIREKKGVTVQELKQLLGASESTIRRDLTLMDQRGLLTKVFGGAVAADAREKRKEETAVLREEVNWKEKIAIAEYAASLVKDGDFVYLDAGTTTGYMIPFLEETTASFVTNSVFHALKLLDRGFRVNLIGGEITCDTKTMIGNEAYVGLQKFNFTVGFFGTNGVSRNRGFTTYDINEAMIKQCAMQHTQKKYILCDHEKFCCNGTVTFGEFSSAVILTDRILDDGYRGCRNIKEVPANLWEV